MSERPQSWAGSAIWAVLDYGLFALAGMIGSVLLARGLSAHTYGAYAVSFAVYLAVFLLHSAIFSEPMLVLLAHRFRASAGSYLRALLAGHALFSLAAMSFTALVAVAAPLDPELRRAVLYMALAAPFMNLAQLARRVCYALASTRAAAAGAGAYLLLLTAAFLALESAERLELSSAYAAFAGASLLVASEWLARAFRSAGGGGETLPLATVMRAHLEYARSGIGTALLNWVPHNLWYLILPLVAADRAELDASGHLRALVNLVQPMLQVNGALATLLVPTFTRALASAQATSPWKVTLRMTALSAAYAPLLAAFGPLANDILYRGAYPADARSLWALGAVPMSFALAASLRAYSVARGQPRLPLWAAAIGAGACLTAGVALCAWRPLLGSALAMLLGFSLQAVSLAWLVATRSTPQHPR